MFTVFPLRPWCTSLNRYSIRLFYVTLMVQAYFNFDLSSGS